MEASISLKNVSKQYELRKALKHVSFGVEKGTIFGLVGPSGAGKTTLLQILTTLLRPDDGTVYIQGLNLETRAAKIRALTGYVPETNTLNPELTIFENLRLHGILSGLSQDLASTRAMRHLAKFDMVDRAHDLPRELSYGLQRRAVVARALVSHPQILYLDAPTATVDFETRTNIWKNLFELRGKTTIFFTSRDIRNAEQYADRIMILAEGEIIMDGSAESLRSDSYRTPAYSIQFKSDNPEYEKRLRSIVGVTDLSREGREYTLQLEPDTTLDSILRNFNPEQIERFSIHEPSLNEIMMDLIRKKRPLTE